MTGPVRLSTRSLWRFYLLVKIESSFTTESKRDQLSNYLKYAIAVLGMLHSASNKGYNKCSETGLVLELKKCRWSDIEKLKCLKKKLGNMLKEVT